MDGFVGRLFDSNWEAVTAFWDAASARYGGRSHVVFEIWNEPADGNDGTDALFHWSDWRPFGERLNGIIRQRSGNLIIAPGPHWTSDLSEVPTSPYSDTNLAYAVHVYPNFVEAGEDPRPEWDRTFGFLAETYPIVVSEWSYHDANGNEATGSPLKDFGQPFMEYMDAHRFSWMAFEYYPIGLSSLVELVFRTPTEFGAFVRESLADVRRSRP